MDDVNLRDQHYSSSESPPGHISTPACFFFLVFAIFASTRDFHGYWSLVLLFLFASSPICSMSRSLPMAKGGVKEPTSTRQSRVISGWGNGLLQYQIRCYVLLTVM